MSAVVAYEKLVVRGCLCGTDRVRDCPLHLAGDNRGIAAWFKAGMPHGFPYAAHCVICGAEGLMYPNVELDDPNRSGEHRPTLACPGCSQPAAEAALVREALDFGYLLNDRRVFAAPLEEAA